MAHDKDVSDVRADTRRRKRDGQLFIHRALPVQIGWERSECATQHIRLQEPKVAANVLDHSDGWTAPELRNARDARPQHQPLLEACNHLRARRRCLGRVVHLELDQHRPVGRWHRDPHLLVGHHQSLGEIAAVQGRVERARRVR